MLPSSSTEAQESLPEGQEALPKASHRLEDVLAYLQCPLKAHYLSWGAKVAVRGPKDRVAQAVETALGVFLANLARSPRHAFTAGSLAEKSFNAALFPGGVKNMDEAALALYGMESLRRFADFLAKKDSMVVCGPLPEIPVTVRDVEIVGDLTGVIRFNTSPGMTCYAATHVYHGEKPRPSWEKVLEGYKRQALQAAVGRRGGNREVAVLRLDPYSRTINIISESHAGTSEFEALVRAASAGLQAGVAVPHQSQQNCGRCSFEKVCSLRYCRPDAGVDLKREFLNAWKKAAGGPQV